MKIFIVFNDKRFSNPIRYIFNLIMNFLGIKFEIFQYSELPVYYDVSQSLLLSYGNSKCDINAYKHIHIYQSKLFSKTYGSFSSMPELPLKRYRDIPIIYEGNGNLNEFAIHNGNFIETKIDIIASSFFMLSRYEEYLVDERDQFNRFPAQASIAYKEGFLTRPIVNEYIELLWDWIESFDLGFKRKRICHKYDFGVCLTHDVDHSRKWKDDGIYDEIKYWGSILLKRRKPLSALRRMIDAMRMLIDGIDPYWNFDEIIELEREYGFSSSFYFFGGGGSPIDARYSIHEEEISDLINYIKGMGCEVGLHGSFFSYNDMEKLRAEKENLEKIAEKVFSIRQHVLRFDIQKTFTIYEKIGIPCDVTLGYAQHEGFRSGICHPFYPYNIEEDRPFNVIEIPLIIMDCGLGELRYRNLDGFDAWISIESLFSHVKKHNGCVSILFHNSYIDHLGHEEYFDLYKRCLHWISENNGIGLSANQVIKLIGKDSILGRYG